MGMAAGVPQLAARFGVMSGKTDKASSGTPIEAAGGGLREQVEAAGIALAESYSALLGSLPGRPSGPQALADLLGINVVTASRLLRAIDLADPVAVIEQIPGTVPLRRTLAAAIAQGAGKDRVKSAEKAVDAFEKLIRKNAGHRSSLNAMLTDWLPQGRREFETRRRQAAYKAISELKGVSCDLDLATIILHPSAEAGTIDLLSIQGTFGLDRIRPDSVVQFGTLRAPASESQGALSAELKAEPRPQTLDGDPANDGLHSVRLDQFCSCAPAPIVTHRFGRDIQYLLGQTGFGPDSSVDFVIAEVNRGEIRFADAEAAQDSELKPPYFFQMPAAPSKAMLFDLLIHRDLFPDFEPELLVYDTSIRGPARAGAPERDVDLMRTSDAIEVIGYRPSRLRFSGFPRYRELLDYAFDHLSWNADDFRAYRLQMSYPLHGTQACMALKSTLEP